MHGLSREVVRPGCTLLELLDLRVASGNFFTQDTERYRSSLLAEIGQRKTVTKITLLPDGRIICIINNPTADGGWVATHEDVTDKVKAQNAEAEKTHQLDAALDNMSQGLCMFDAEQRLIVCNRRYADLYGLSDEQTKPGTTLRAILEHRIAIGHAPKDHERYRDRINEVTRNEPYQTTNRLLDGRYIFVVYRPMADGGWVATHEDVTEIKNAEERIAYQAFHDALTGVANRVLFYELVEQALKRVPRGERLAVLYLDLDHFKGINDTLGHPIGDKLLKGVADRLRGCIRDVDVVARLSGDEFAIIQSSLGQPVDAATLAKRLREVIIEPFDLDGHHVVVDISAGIAIAPNDATELDELLKAADIALYEAKKGGRGTYCFYETEMNTRIHQRAKLEADLRSALANGEFELFYQPRVKLENNKISAFEVLLRWHHPGRGMVSPTEFIPIAEETGLIIPLGEFVLRAACAEAATWPSDINVAVNISAAQFTDKNLINVVNSAIASAGLPANRLELEITESVLMQNTSANLATLKQLHDLGVRFAMDDFGTGYSSLGYLLSFPFDNIKIDRSFIIGLSERPESRAIVRAVAQLAQDLSITLTAEGVETEQQLEQVKQLGCTEMQGYLFSRPHPAEEMRRLFLSSAKNASGHHNFPDAA